MGGGRSRMVRAETEGRTMTAIDLSRGLGRGGVERRRGCVRQGFVGAGASSAARVRTERAGVWKQRTAEAEARREGGASPPSPPSRLRLLVHCRPCWRLLTARPRKVFGPSGSPDLPARTGQETPLRTRTRTSRTDGQESAVPGERSERKRCRLLARSRRLPSHRRQLDSA